MIRTKMPRNFTVGIFIMNLNKQMKKSIILIAVVIGFEMASAFGQQPAKRDMAILARGLAEQISEVSGNGLLSEPYVLKEHYLCCDVEDEELGRVTLQIYRYERPFEATDRVLVAYNSHNFPVGTWLKCFMLDRKTGVFTPAELPFELLPPSRFDKEAFEEDPNYWSAAYTIFDNGNVLITASPSMSYHCVMLARWEDKESFTLYKRAGYDFMNMEIGKDDAQTERYVQNVVRPNFQRINAITKWVYVEKRKDHTPPLGNTERTYYYSNNGLEKMVVNASGTAYKRVIEYYFIDGHLSFVYDITTQYGLPKNSNTPDTKIERRWYIEGNTCIRGIGDKGQKLTPAQIREEFLGDGKQTFPLYTNIINH